MYRQLQQRMEKLLDGAKSPIILILGLRQTGKTTLAKQICSRYSYQFFSFDLAGDRNEFAKDSRHSLAQFARRYKDQILLIDEVQKLPQSTEVIKYLYDHYSMKFVLTGSSELKITKTLGDSLAGRVRIFRLYPLTIKEILVQEGELKEKESVKYDQARSIEERVAVYGSLPNLENIKLQDFVPYLRDFTDSLLAKDILEIAAIKKSTKIYELARLLALQIGQLVNVNELSQLLELTRTSVYNYLDILERLSIIHRAYPVSTNERKAIGSKFKVYFTDLGVRNILINDFSDFDKRLDRGALLENLVYMGLKRQLDYKDEIYKLGFFRSRTGTEIDIVFKDGKEEKLYEVKSRKKYLTKKGNVRYATPENAWEFLV